MNEDPTGFKADWGRGKRDNFWVCSLGKWGMTTLKRRTLGRQFQERERSV